MKTLDYEGFTGPARCHYAVGELLGKKVVVFVQGPLTNTSITNKIEVLASLVLSNDLIGVNPRDVRFFEHYPPSLQGREWQEVEFAEHLPLADGQRSLLTKMLAAVTGPSSPTAWAVDKPQWLGMATDKVPVELRRLVNPSSIT